MAERSEHSDQVVGAVRVRIRYFAAARAVTGVDSDVLAIGSPPTVGAALHAAVALHGPRLAEVLRRCSYLLGEIAVHSEDSVVTDGDVLDVLPPFAGG